jgi:hypothetical protein
MKFVLLLTPFYTNLSNQALSAAVNESILALLSKQTESFYSLCGIGHPTTFHSEGLAWQLLAWLAQILLLIKVST